MSSDIKAFVPPIACDRVIGQYRFEDGSVVAIIAVGKADTALMLDFVEEIIAYKRKELASIAAKVAPPSADKPK